MRLVAALLAAFVCCGFGHGGGTFTTQVNKTTSDYSILCNGTADDTTTWGNFVSDNQGKNVVFTVPRGSVCCFNGGELAYGIANLRVIGYGATITNFCNGSVGGPYFLGTGGGFPHAGGIVQDNTHSSLIATVAAGSNFVTLLTPAETSRFTVGNWALTTGGDTQGGGFPPNPWVHDYVLITGKDGSCQGTGTVCFHDPLQNGYKSTWPCYPGCVTNAWVGGPATLYAIDPGWGGVVEWRGITFTLKASPTVDGQIKCAGRVCRYVDVAFTGVGSACAFPSENMSSVFQNVSGPGCGIEADKIVDQFLVERSTLSEIDFASAASITQLLLTQSPMSHLACTPLTAVLSFSTIGFLQKGGCGFGPAKSVILNTMSWTTIQDVTTGQTSVDSAFTMSGGVMSQVLGTPPQWAVPGGGYLFTDGVHSDVPVTVNDLSASGGNLQVTTNQGGGFPFTPLNIKSIPVPTTINP